MKQLGWFDGREALVQRSGGMINVYYGGSLKPDGTGHGHVKATGGPLGENIVYWRLPAEYHNRQQIHDPEWQRSETRRLSDRPILGQQTWISHKTVHFS